MSAVSELIEDEDDIEPILPDTDHGEGVEEMRDDGHSIPDERAEVQEDMKELKEVSNAPRQLDNDEMIEFLTAYPGIEPKNIPKQVWDDVKKGVNLTDAFNRVHVKQQAEMLRQMSARIYAFEHNDKNAERAIGSMRNGQIVVTRLDPFMDAFDRA